MEEKELQRFKEKLEAMKVEINSDVEQTLTEMTTQTGNIPDPNDRATMESDRSFELRIRGRERKQLPREVAAQHREEDQDDAAGRVDDPEGDPLVATMPLTSIV